MLINDLRFLYFLFQMSKGIARQEVPVYFDGKVLLVKNVTKYTTCSDVVHMLMLKSGISIERISSYTLFEVTGDLQRMLQGRTRIIKTLRSWGCEKDSFRFVLRNTEEDKTCLLNNQCYKLINHSHNVNCSEGTTSDTKLPGSPLELNINNVVNPNNNDSLVKHAHDKSLKQDAYENTMKGTHIKFINSGDDLHPPERNEKISKTCRSKKSKGKQIFFKKCLSSLIPFHKSKRLLQKDGKSAGNKNEKLLKHAHVDCNENLIGEIDDLLRNQFHTLEEQCRYYWNSNSESDDESDFEDEKSSYRDTDLNNAFLKGVTEASEELNVGGSFNYSDVYGSDLNDAFVNSHHGINDSFCLTDVLEGDDESFSDSSECELDKNITSCDVVRNIFCGHLPGGAIAEDEEMDSFMRTYIYESDSEESLV